MMFVVWRRPSSSALRLSATPAVLFVIVNVSPSAGVPEIASDIPSKAMDAPDVYANGPGLDAEPVTENSFVACA